MESPVEAIYSAAVWLVDGVLISRGKVIPFDHVAKPRQRSKITLCKPTLK
ncbi:hypothetical protein HanPSC8_Chr06g0238051 [Helianthus annuus]|nr:hypothetical protein HanPSC8_Chr06g0238051 [Helianthus annuus]